MSSASELPNYVNHGEIDWGKEQGNQNAVARIMWCGEDMIETFGLELSSGSFYDKERKIALEEGSTMVRIGTAIFGARACKIDE